MDTIWCDDSMWGFPIGGVLMGAYSEEKNKFELEEVQVTHFKSPNFERKSYLDEIGIAVLSMVQRIGAQKSDKIMVCRGYCNNVAEILLKKNGFTNVHRGVIGEPLQSYLEKQAKEYIKTIGYDEYYDPKELGSKKEIVTEFSKVIKWVHQKKRYDLAKTGWKFWKKQKMN